MTVGSDHPEDMPNPLEPDEAVADLLLDGRLSRPGGSDAGLVPVVDYVTRLRATVSQPPAPVSPALAAVLRDGLPTPPVPVAPRSTRTAARWRRRVTGFALGMGLVASGVTGAAAANLLPDGAQRVVAGLVEALTPFELPTPAPSPAPPATTPQPAGNGSGGDIGAGITGQEGHGSPTGQTQASTPSGSQSGPAGGAGTTVPAPTATPGPAGSGAAVPTGSASGSPGTTTVGGTPAVLPSVPSTTVPGPSTPSLPTPPSTTVPTPTTPPTTLPRLPPP